MSDELKIIIEFTRKELEILINATGSSQPSLENEFVQYKLYHKLISKLNENKL